MGNVKSLPRTVYHSRGNGFFINIKERIMSPYPGGLKDKYDCVDLSMDGKNKKFFIHKLVAQYFLGDTPDGMIIDHIDENQRNNRVDNLQFITQSENIRKSRKINTARKHVRTKIKLTDIKTGEELIFDDCEKAAEFVGVWSTSIIQHADRTWSGIVQGKYEVTRI